MIGRLTALRQRPEFRPVEADLNQLVSEVLGRLDGIPHVELTKELQPLPGILADREQIRSVVTNLVLNARDALGPEGCICVHGACGRQRCSLRHGQRLRDERGVPEALVVSPVSEHEEEGARHPACFSPG